MSISQDIRNIYTGTYISSMAGSLRKSSGICLERKQSRRNRGTTPIFVWRRWEAPLNIAIITASVLTMIVTEHFLNASLQPYQYTHVLLTCNIHIIRTHSVEDNSLKSLFVLHQTLKWHVKTMPDISSNLHGNRWRLPWEYFYVGCGLSLQPSLVVMIRTGRHCLLPPTELTPLGAHKKITSELRVRPNHLSQLPCGLRLYCLETHATCSFTNITRTYSLEYRTYVSNSHCYTPQEYGIMPWSGMGCGR